MLKITITYDMVFKKRSSGRIYESSSGHAFIISGISKVSIGTVLYSKARQKRNATDKREEEA